MIQYVLKKNINKKMPNAYGYPSAGAYHREGIRSRTEVWQQGRHSASAPHAYLHGMLLNNVNILLNEAPLKGDPEDPVALFKEACKNEEENINVLFNTLNDAMKELAEE